MYMMIESVEVSAIHPGIDWVSLYSLFGLSPDIDSVLIETITLRDELHHLAHVHGLVNYQYFELGTKFYAIVFCENLNTIKTYFNSDPYLKYVKSSKNLCELMDHWEFNGWRIVPAEALSTVDVNKLNFEVVSELWDKTVPITEN